MSKTTMKSITLAIIFISLNALQMYAQVPFLMVQPEEVGISSERLQRLDDMLRDYANQQRVAGSVTLILRDGRAVYFEASGYKDVENKVPMTRDALFRIASQTKAIVSAGVMILQEQGKILISDPVGNYLPEFLETTVAIRSPADESYEIVPATRPITIRDLLTHTAGISYGYGIASDRWREAGIQGWYLADRDEPIREIVRRIAELPMDAQPGERFVYGYATDILGALIEVVSGQTLDHFLEEEIFTPLQMKDTHFFIPPHKADRMTVVYSATSERGIKRAPDPGDGTGQGHYIDGPAHALSGGAGLVSTAEDYARFLQMMLNGGILNGVRILSPTTVELMTVNHLKDIQFRPGEGVGLGFDVVTNLGYRGRPGAIGDFGWGGAYHTTYWVSPQDALVVVFFTQLRPSAGSDIHGKLRTLLYQAIID
ncbi:MAG: beta-lactamase family protein [Balneolales bacterium]|nr:beta-lactamase family protein [Balneolales bacterium]